MDPESLASTCARWSKGAPPDNTHPIVDRPEPQVAEEQADPIADLRRRFAKHIASEADWLAGTEAMQDLGATRRRVHRLAGAAGNLGFPEVTHAARACEQRIKDASPQDSVRAAIDSVVQTIRDGLGPDAASD